MTSPTPSPERPRTSSEEQLREREEEVVMAPDDEEDGRRLSHGGYHRGARSTGFSIVKSERIPQIAFARRLLEVAGARCYMTNCRKYMMPLFGRFSQICDTFLRNNIGNIHY